ncbi:MAG: hypothetical protein Q4C10_13315, partial [Clostridia bacterium]|nr:hypothetical protein [Clostridia bacterium]
MKSKLMRSISMVIAMMLTACAVLPALAEDKKETVFVMADAAGSPDRVVVSERLYNPDGADVLTDVSTLDDIRNVGGEETFSVENGMLVWRANGADISYEGTTDAPLPVGVELSYSLDGEPCAPEALAGRSGHLEIDIRYSASERRQADVSGESVEMPVPFLMATVMLLDPDIYSNVEVTNGKVIDAGNLKAAVCFGLPGVREALNLDAYEDVDVNIPETATITADVVNYASSGSYTLATNSVFNLREGDRDSLVPEDVDLDGVSTELNDAVDQILDGIDALYDGTGELKDGADDLHEGAGKLKDGTGDLLDGAGDLKGGTEDLLSGANDLKDGAGDLKDGAEELSDGLAEIDANSGDLRDGALKIFEAILDTANEGLVEKKDDFAKLGIQLRTLTAENYESEIERLERELLDKVEDYVYEQADRQLEQKVRAAVHDEVTRQVNAAAKEKVEKAVREAAREKVREQVEAGASDLVRQQVEAGAREQVRPQVEQAVAQKVREAVEAAARQKVESAVRNPDAATVNAKVAEQMQSSDVQAQIEAAVAEQMASDTVKGMIDQQLDQAIRPQVEQAYESGVREQVTAVVRSQVRDQVTPAVEAQVRAAVKAEVE